MSSKLTYVLMGLVVAVAATGTQAVTLTVGPDADTYVIDDSTGDTPHGDAPYLYTHDTDDGVAYVRFDLAALNVLTIEDATLTMVVAEGAPRNDNLVTGRFWVFGLDNMPGNTPQDWDEATLSRANVGAEYGDPLVNVTDLDGAVDGVTEAVENVAGLDYWVAGSRIATLTGETFVTWLQSRVDDNGLVTLLLYFPGRLAGASASPAKSSRLRNSARCWCSKPPRAQEARRSNRIQPMAPLRSHAMPCSVGSRAPSPQRTTCTSQPASRTSMRPARVFWFPRARWPRHTPLKAI